MDIKMILPALTEAESPYWRPIKYSLFPPLGLATLAAYCDPSDSVEIIDQHVEPLLIDDFPDLVVIQVYITNAYRAYKIADEYRAKGCYVVLGGLHVSSLPFEAAMHADSIFIGPAEHTFPQFLRDFKSKKTKARYSSFIRTLDDLPPIRRDLIKRHLYLVPNSIVVSRGCPFHCGFCYKDAFFEGGKSFYTQQVDKALAEIERLPGRHLYFLDDHLLGNRKFAAQLFDGMKGMNRVFQGAATVDSILRGDLIEKAAEAGLRSLFVGFESINSANHKSCNKVQNLGHQYEKVVERLDSLGIMINGSFVFGLDEDDKDVFQRTVEWAVNQGITTATFHIATPYPGTDYYKQMQKQQRIVTTNWDLYDTRHVVFKPKHLSVTELKQGYDRAYQEFYSWKNIGKASLNHGSIKHRIKHFAYSAGWKKFEPLWNLIIKTKQLSYMRPLLESVLSEVPTQDLRCEEETPVFVIQNFIKYNEANNTNKRIAPKHRERLMVRRSIPAILFFSFICWIVVLADTGSDSIFFRMVRTMPYGDKLGHLILYGILTLLVIYATAFKSVRLGRWNVQIGVILVLTFALAEEVTQLFLPLRTFDVFDLFADLLGALIASVVLTKYFRTQRPSGSVPTSFVVASSEDK